MGEALAKEASKYFLKILKQIDTLYTSTSTNELNKNELLKKEMEMKGKHIRILTADLKKTELAVDVLDAMAKNMEHTTYEYYIYQNHNSDDFTKVIREMRTCILKRNPKIDIVKRLKFFSVTSDLETVLFQRFKNLICFKYGRKKGEAYQLIVHKNVWENSESMEPHGDNLFFYARPYINVHRIFSLLNKKARRL